MTTPAPIRVGVVGLGKIAQTHHLPNIREIPGLELASVCDISAQLARSIAGRYGLSEDAATTQVSDLLDGRVDALVVANRDHLPLVAAASAAGLPVFVEKPLCWSTLEAQQLLSIEASTGVPVVVGYMKRYDAAVERVASALDDGNPPLWVRSHNFAGGRHRTERLYQIDKPEPPGDGMSENDSINAVVTAAVGPDPSRVEVYRLLAELGIHHFNLLAAWFGPLTVTTAGAQLTEAGWCVTVGFRAGRVQGVFEILPDFLGAREWDERISLYRPGSLTELVFGTPFVRNEPTIICERGSDAGDAVFTETLVSRESAFKRELQHFLEVVLDKVPARTSVREAVRDLTFIDEVMTKLVIT
ncbi:Gfo/Idh/MocA family protein [Kribbella sp. NPDC056345]|uniref:Gfo/Idh/MocA family protein n=1 Tax=Kribbella sp. NPDC056345 TaxID=3345789 RepID=UPI0035DFC2B4